MAEVKSNIYFGDLTSSIRPMAEVFSFGSARNDQWVNMEDDDGEVCDSASATSCSSSFSDTDLSVSCSASSSSSDLVEDACSSLTSCSSSESSTVPLRNSKGPLYDISELMIQLPIKRGLSKHFQGKSQSFTSLSSVKCLEDLPKKKQAIPPCRNKKMKACKSYGGGLDTQKCFSPRTCSNKTISKKKKNIVFINCSRSSRPPLCAQIENDF